MNEGSSSSASSPADSPAFAWGEGHPVRFAVADHHTQGRFAAQTIVLIDSCFTQAVYGQHAKRADERQIHSMQTLHINNEKLADDADLIVLQSYELAKATLNNIYTETNEAFREAQALASTCITHFPEVVQTKSGIDALAWCVTAYSMVVNPISPVKLVQRPMIPNGPRGFGIIARRFIQEGEYIYELPGMIAKTSRPNIQSTLSIIIPHHRQNQGSEERVLFGPLRFVNHICKGSNITWEAIDNSCGYTTVALKDIEAGDELYANYGSDYFNDLEEGCPCRSCNAQWYEAAEEDAYERQKQQQEKEEMDKQVIADKKKERNKRRREKQKSKSNVA